MSGHKCAYYDCGLTTRQNPSTRKFRFPVKNPIRCRQWILNSGKLTRILCTKIYLLST